MARNIPAPALAKVSQQYGAELINIIEIQWVEGGPRIAYADRDIPGGVLGKVQELSGLDAVIQVSNGGDSQEISIKLDDIDGSIKDILDHNDIHKRPCWVYQWFDGLDLDDKFLLFNGEISSPITWNEGDRTVSFDVISKIEDAEVGFSIEEGQFVNPPDDLIGKPWPLCFGTTINVPALQLQTARQATLASGVGIMDPTLYHRLNYAQRLVCPLVLNGFRVKYPNVATPLYFPNYGDDADCVKRKCETIERHNIEIAEQSAFQFGSFTVYGGEFFPQGVNLTININGAVFYGYFTGQLFTVLGRRHPRVNADGTYIFPPVEQTIQSRCVPIRVTDANGLPFPMINGQYADPNANMADYLYPDGIPGQSQTLRQALSKKTWDLYNSIPELGFFWANPGSKVILDGENELVYIANIIPSTITRVAAYRDLPAGRQLISVPASYYEVRQVDYGNYQVMEVVLDRPLSSREEGWEDDLFITQTASIGPNTVDIIEWVIEQYTDFEIDTASFDHVRTAIDNYPSHFPVLDRPNVVQFLQDIAFQARCELWLRDGTFYIRYLSEEPTAIETITISDMEQNSMELFHTETEDLVTKYVCQWIEDYQYEDDPKTLILRYNVPKYGTHEEERLFNIYNIYDYVLKSGTFWLIRKSITWRKIRFRTYFNKLKIEPMDCVEITHPALSPVPVKCICEKATWNSDTKRIEFEFWTPIRSGEMLPYPYVWPQLLPELTPWPTAEDDASGVSGGSGPNFSTIAPANHPLNPQRKEDAGGLNVQSGPLFCLDGTQVPPPPPGGTWGSCGQGKGDKKPSDVNDEKKTPKTPSGSGEINTGSSPTSKSTVIENKLAVAEKKADQALQEAQQARAEAANANENAGGDETDTLEDLPERCGGNCTAIVRLRYILPTRVSRPVGTVPLTTDDPGATGRPAISTVTKTECYTFNSAGLAAAFATAKEAEAQAMFDNFGYTNGVENVGPGGAGVIFTPSIDGELGDDENEFNEDGTENENFGNPCIEPDEDDQAQIGFQSLPEE